METRLRVEITRLRRYVTGDDALVMVDVTNSHTLETMLPPAFTFVSHRDVTCRLAPVSLNYGRSTMIQKTLDRCWPDLSEHIVEFLPKTPYISIPTSYRTNRVDRADLVFMIDDRGYVVNRNYPQFWKHWLNAINIAGSVVW
jgi:hypothetical protein